jgi:hypothetical protein
MTLWMIFEHENGYAMATLAGTGTLARILYLAPPDFGHDPGSGAKPEKLCR